MNEVKPLEMASTSCFDPGEDRINVWLLWKMTKSLVDFNQKSICKTKTNTRVTTFNVLGVTWKTYKLEDQRIAWPDMSPHVKATAFTSCK